MSVQDIIRAWKDKEFRAGLSEAQRALLPENPAGAIELSAAALEHVWGGKQPGGCFGSYSGLPGCTYDNSDYCWKYTQKQRGCV